MAGGTGGGSGVTDLSGVDLTEVDLPEVDLPEVDLPEVDIPEVVDLPEGDLPEVDPPGVDLPEVNLPGIDLLEVVLTNDGFFDTSLVSSLGESIIILSIIYYFNIYILISNIRTIYCILPAATTKVQQKLIIKI